MGTCISEADERGASAVEYGLLIAGIAAVVAIAVFVLGGTVGGLFNDTCDEFDAQETVSATCH
jgi:pilus assembly protein Flp/PilA